MRERSCGLAVAPNSGFTESHQLANSETLVLPSRIAPAARIAATGAQSASLTWSASSFEPFGARMPATANGSLHVNGTPCSGPLGATLSAATASSRASSSRGNTSALISGSRSAIRAACASNSSTRGDLALAHGASHPRRRLLDQCRHVAFSTGGRVGAEVGAEVGVGELARSTPSRSATRSTRTARALVVGEAREVLAATSRRSTPASFQFFGRARAHPRPVDPALRQLRPAAGAGRATVVVGLGDRRLVGARSSPLQVQHVGELVRWSSSSRSCSRPATSPRRRDDRPVLVLLLREDLRVGVAAEDVLLRASPRRSCRRPSRCRRRARAPTRGRRTSCPARRRSRWPSATRTRAARSSACRAAR